MTKINEPSLSKSLSIKYKSHYGSHFYIIIRLVSIYVCIVFQFMYCIQKAVIFIEYWCQFCCTLLSFRITSIVPQFHHTSDALSTKWKIVFCNLNIYAQIKNNTPLIAVAQCFALVWWIMGPCMKMLRHLVTE